MILHIHSNASYLSVSNARSRLGGLFFLGNKSPEQDTLNGSILNVASVIKNVVTSAAESEVVACFHNAQSSAPLRVTLTELGHTQPLLMIVQSLGWLRFYSFVKPAVLLDYSLEVR
jgi:hypothetical protein